MDGAGIGVAITRMIILAAVAGALGLLLLGILGYGLWYVLQHLRWVA